MHRRPRADPTLVDHHDDDHGAGTRGGLVLHQRGDHPHGDERDELPVGALRGEHLQPADPERPAGRRAGAFLGAHVFVATAGTNNGQQSIDLTCGYPIANKLVDTQGRQYDSIDGLSQIAGNPQCNASVQPGFDFQMTWVYLVPPGATVAEFVFEDLGGSLAGSGASGSVVRVRIPNP